MTISSISPSPTGWAYVNSAWGSAPWYGYDNASVQAVVPVQAASCWIVWKVTGNIPGNQAFNGINFNGPVWFTCRSGPGTQRIANLYVDMFKTFNECIGATPVNFAGITCYNNGVHNTCNYLLQKPGFTSNDLQNGIYVCAAIATSEQEPWIGDGLYNFEAMDWRMWWGQDQPGGGGNPQAPNGQWSNPVDNNNPGKIPGSEWFGTLAWNALAPNPSPATVHPTFLIRGPAGITFQDTGTQIKGPFAWNNPLYDWAYTGSIMIAPTTPVGDYAVEIQIPDLNPSFSGFAMQAPIRVRGGSSGGLLTEA